MLPSHNRIREIGGVERSAGGGSNGHPAALAMGYPGIVAAGLVAIVCLL
ncbi:MAG TPA: hypothetical protein VG365_15190 [Solirubrobacteraceae bacterium]|jgi:hypothetical protein|nr:hypothetical protein [Solirubrobacteraceae bacterium]